MQYILIYKKSTILSFSVIELAPKSNSPPNPIDNFVFVLLVHTKTKCQLHKKDIYAKAPYV